MSPLFLLRSLAARIAIAAALLGVGVIAIVSVLGYVALAHQLTQRATDELDAKRTLLRHILREIPTTAVLTEHRHRLDDVLTGHEDLHLAVFDASGANMVATFSPLAQTLSPDLLSRLRAMPLTVVPAVQDWIAPEGQSMLVAMGTAPFAQGELTRFVLVQDRRADDKLLANYALALAVVLPMALLVAVVGAWLTATSGLSPLRRFSRLAGSVSSQALAGRIDVPGLPSELRELATSFNAMLARIDTGVTRLNEFSGDLAHEMRTPISIVLGRTQVALAKPRDADALREVLASNVDELERMTRLVADMLFLAQADQDKHSLERELLQLDTEARVVADFLSDVAAERELRINVVGAAQIQGNRILVQRAITNLLSNAIRHASAGSAIDVTISEAATGRTLDVSNDGTPIGVAHLEKLFDRFYRVNADRSRGTGGIGLGLAIVRSIMSMHNGEVTVMNSSSRRVSFRLLFPESGADVKP
jgi:two-component system, OmpR family, heavy metal sensor histidine kinase CusS